MKQDNRITGEQNKLAVLTHLQRFGWLTSRMLAALVWPDSRESLAMARRCLRELLKQKLVLKRTLPTGGECYTLSMAGARTLKSSLGIEARSGATLKLGNPLHRACGNWFLIECLRQGNRIWTEHEIQQGLAPIRSIHGKIPDALIESEHGITWVEVENSWKNIAERKKILSLCQILLPRMHSTPMYELAHDKFLFRIAIVSNTTSALKSIVNTFTQAYHADELTELQASDIELHSLPLNPSLIPEQVAAGNLWYDAIALRVF